MGAWTSSVPRGSTDHLTRVPSHPDHAGTEPPAGQPGVSEIEQEPDPFTHFRCISEKPGLGEAWRFLEEAGYRLLDDPGRLL